MAYTQIREKAIALRKKGESINTISKSLGAKKSTVSYWCKDILLSKDQINALLEKQRREGIKGSFQYYEKLRKERIKRCVQLMQKGVSDVGSLSKRDLFISGLSLYWAEGYKKGNEVGFTNSDPKMIVLFLKWLKEIYGINSDSLIFRISINNMHKDRVNKVIGYWTKLLKVEEKQFTKTSLIRTISKKVYSNHENYFGTLRVKIRRGSALRERILGSIQEISKIQM